MSRRRSLASSRSLSFSDSFFFFSLSESGLLLLLSSFLSCSL
jgi:hypothetical protein